MSVKMLYAHIIFLVFILQKKDPDVLAP